MKVQPKNIKKHQMGGQMEPTMGSSQEPMPEGPTAGAQQTPEQGGEQDPIMMLAQMSAQALQSQDCQIAMLVCQAFLEIIQQTQGPAPQEPQGEPIFRKGGILVRRIKK